MFTTVAIALASIVENPTPENILPSMFDTKVVTVVSEAVMGYK